MKKRNKMRTGTTIAYAPNQAIHVQPSAFLLLCFFLNQTLHRHPSSHSASSKALTAGGTDTPLAAPSLAATGAPMPNAVRAVQSFLSSGARRYLVVGVCSKGEEVGGVCVSVLSMRACVYRKQPFYTALQRQATSLSCIPCQVHDEVEVGQSAQELTRAGVEPPGLGIEERWRGRHDVRGVDALLVFLWRRSVGGVDGGEEGFP